MSDDRPLRISVVIPSLNHARFLRLALDSALGQAGPFDLEVLVVDGGSADGTVDLLRSYGPRVRWVSEPDGPARSMVVTLAGEGEPEQVMKSRGLEVVRDDSALQSAVDEALAANPDVAEKIRGGKVQAAGAIVGAVMKATKRSGYSGTSMKM